MTIPVPHQIRNGLGRCRTALQGNQAQIEACVADMGRDPAVDLTDELERLTTEGDGLRRKLRMFEDAAAIAVENQQVQVDIDFSKRKRELGEQAIEEAARRTQIAEQLESWLDTFTALNRSYLEADEHARVAFWQAVTIDMPYERAYLANVDGSCRSTLLDNIARLILENHHAERLSVASGCREIYMRSVIADIERAAPISALGVSND